MIHEQFKVQNCGENAKNVRVDGGCGRSNEKTLTCCFMSHLYKQIWMQNLEVIDRIVVLLCFWFPFVVRAVMTNYV